MVSVYSHLYGNSRHDGFVNFVCKSTGKLSWSKRISAEPEGRADARVLLSTEDRVIVVGMRAIFSFTVDGQREWCRAKWPGSHVVLQGGLVYYTSASRKDRMEAIDLSNEVQLQDFAIPEIIDESYMVLFEPDEEGLVAQVQYPDLPHLTKRSFILYRIRRGGLGYQWSKRYLGAESRMIPIVGGEQGCVVTATQTDVLVFELASRRRDAEPVSTFPLPFERETVWASLGADGLLYLAGVDRGRTSLVATDLGGKERWRWRSVQTPARGPTPIAPPILGVEGVGVLAAGEFYLVKEGELSWIVPAVEGRFVSATALGDGSSLVAEEGMIHRLDRAGQKLFEVPVGEPILTSPTVDGQGRAYVAGRETLLAFS